MYRVYKSRADSIVAYPTTIQATLSITLSESLKTTLISSVNCNEFPFEFCFPLISQLNFDKRMNQSKFNLVTPFSCSFSFSFSFRIRIRFLFNFHFVLPFLFSCCCCKVP